MIGIVMPAKAGIQSLPAAVVRHDPAAGKPGVYGFIRLRG
jgi:hypothetical protein